MIDEATRQVDHFPRRRRDPGLPGSEWIFQNAVGVGDVKRVADDDYAERRDQVIDENALQLGLAVAVSVAEQGDLLRRSASRARSLLPATAAMSKAHDKVADRVLGPVDGFGSDALGFHHENIAVGQRVDVARTGKTGRHCLNLETGRDGRRFSRLPAHDLGHADRRNELLMRLGQDGIGTLLLRGIDLLAASASRHWRNQRDEEEAVHGRTSIIA